MTIISKKIAKPRLSSKYLNQQIECLSGHIANPWLCKKEFVQFHCQLVKLVEASKAIVCHMDKNLESATKRHAQATPVRDPESHSLLTTISAAEKVKSCYTDLNLAIASMECYQPFHLLEFKPKDRFSRRAWLASLSCYHLFASIECLTGEILELSTLFGKCLQIRKTKMKQHTVRP